MLKNRLGGKTQATRQAGIALQENSFALAVVRRSSETKPSLDYCAVHPYQGDIEAALKMALDKTGAGRASVCGVLNIDEYQMVQVEAPEVLPAEMRSAIRWRLRDAISFNVDEAAVDVFEVPQPARQAEQKMLFAVAAPHSAIQRVASVLKPVARGFNAIDIPELCLRNISALLPQDKKGVAMLALNEKFAQLVVTQNNALYLTRRIDMVSRFELETQDSPAVDVATLALEIQRSLDYYESHYDQAPIGELVLAPTDERASTLAQNLRTETSLQISVLDPRELLVIQVGEAAAADWLSLMALGAALRTDVRGG